MMIFFIPKNAALRMIAPKLFAFPILSSKIACSLFFFHSEISSFEIENLTKEDKSTQECIENGWWYTTLDLKEALNIDMSTNDQYKTFKQN